MLHEMEQGYFSDTCFYSTKHSPSGEIKALLIPLSVSEKKKKYIYISTYICNKY